MNIQVVRKQPSVPLVTNKTIVLLFKKSHLRTQYKKIPIVSMYDEEGMCLPVSLKLTQIQSKIPSVLLSKWINANCAEKLLTLVDKCNTIEKINLDKDERSKWFFTQKDESIYGLHKIKTKCNGEVFRTVMIDSGIGMQSVINILKELQIEVECVYNKKTQKMEKILITGEGL